MRGLGLNLRGTRAVAGRHGRVQLPEPRKDWPLGCHCPPITTPRGIIMTDRDCAPADDGAAPGGPQDFDGEPEPAGVFRWPSEGRPTVLGRMARLAGEHGAPPEPFAGVGSAPVSGVGPAPVSGVGPAPVSGTPPPADFGSASAAGVDAGGAAGRRPGAAPPFPRKPPPVSAFGGPLAGDALAGLAPPGQPAVSVVPPVGVRTVSVVPPVGQISARPVWRDPLAGGRRAPWRRAVGSARVLLPRPGRSGLQRRAADLASRASAPVPAGHHRIAVVSLKGGVGKTTIVMGLGLTLARVRTDRVIALEANPGRGTLCDRLRLETAATVRDLLNERDQIRAYADMRGYTTQPLPGLEVLTSDRDPTMTAGFGADDYREVAGVLERYYAVCITDCGTGLLHSAMAGVLALADQLVLVSTVCVDAARSASATLDWLRARQCGHLAREAVVVLSMVPRRGRTGLDPARLEQHFGARCRSVVRVPYDDRLAEGAEVDLGALHAGTADAFLELAAEVADGFGAAGVSDSWR
jgi:MinD-like ATPase involved in chromosome partitioning or flagellar assembly